MWSSLWILFFSCAEPPQEGEALKPPPPPPAEARAQPTAQDWAANLADVDAHIADMQARLAKTPTRWVDQQALADLYRERARLSGSYDDYALAEQALKAAFAAAAEGSGPWMSQAGLDYTLHRLPAVEPSLQRAEAALLLNNEQKAAILTLRAGVAWQRGEIEAAAAGFQQALALDADGTGPRAGLAAVYSRTGRIPEAEALWGELEAAYHGRSGEPRAWLHLQRGLVDLDRGRLEDALADYQAAEAAMPGYWLVQEHQAEILTLQGHTEEALRIYLEVIARTSNPEFMDAAAAIYQERGETAAAEAQIVRAQALYREQLARYPEAAAGHALEHFLEFGKDPAEALTLAETNAALRPNGEALTLLAQARLAAGDAAGARAAIEPVLATTWSWADTHAVAAEVYRALGEEALAEAQQQREQALRPRP